MFLSGRKINFFLHQVLIFIPGNNSSNTDVTFLDKISSADQIFAVVLELGGQSMEVNNK